MLVIGSCDAIKEKNIHQIGSAPDLVHQDQFKFFLNNVQLKDTIALKTQDRLQ